MAADFNSIGPKSESIKVFKEAGRISAYDHFFGNEAQFTKVKTKQGQGLVCNTQDYVWIGDGVGESGDCTKISDIVGGLCLPTNSELP